MEYFRLCIGYSLSSGHCNYEDFHALLCLEPKSEIHYFVPPLFGIPLKWIKNGVSINTFGSWPASGTACDGHGILPFIAKSWFVSLANNPIIWNKYKENMRNYCTERRRRQFVYGRWPIVIWWLISNTIVLYFELSKMKSLILFFKNSKDFASCMKICQNIKIGFISWITSWPSQTGHFGRI